MREFASDEKTLVKATNLKTGEEMYFPSGADCARYIGCTKQLVSRAVRGTQRSRTARGWLLERVPFSEVLPDEIVLVEGKLLGVSCR